MPERWRRENSRIYDFIDELSSKNRRRYQKSYRGAVIAFASPDQRKDVNQTYDKFDKWYDSLECRAEILDDEYIRPLVGISGSWQKINNEVVRDTSHIVRYILSQGKGIITGGALGVDYIATHTVLTEGIPKEQLRIVLPVDLDTYMKHFINSIQRADRLDGIDSTQARKLIKQLDKIRSDYSDIIFGKTHFNGERFLESGKAGDRYRKSAYHFRNGLVGYGCDGLVAFWVDSSEGVQDIIDKVSSAKAKCRVAVKKYSLGNDRGIIQNYDEIVIPHLSPYLRMEQLN